jgi:hypothetical protein
VAAGGTTGSAKPGSCADVQRRGAHGIFAHLASSAPNGTARYARRQRGGCFRRVYKAGRTAARADGCRCAGGGGGMPHPKAAAAAYLRVPSLDGEGVAHLLRRLRSDLILSDPILSYPIRSYLILSYLIQSGLIRSDPILSYPIRSCLIRSDLILSYLIRSGLIRSDPILSYLIQTRSLDRLRAPACGHHSTKGDRISQRKAAQGHHTDSLSRPSTPTHTRRHSSLRRTRTRAHARAPAPRGASGHSSIWRSRRG